MKRTVILLCLATLFVSGCAHKKVVLLTSEPSPATVTLNDNPIGTTPLSHEIVFPDENGKFNFNFSYPGYFSKDLEVTYLPKEMIDYKVNLDKLSKKITITSTPNEATLYLGGKEVGITPYTDTVYFDQDQEYAYVAKLSMYEDTGVTINYGPEAQTEYQIVLPEVEEIEMEITDYETKSVGGKIVMVTKKKLVRSLKEIIERSPNVKSVSKITSYSFGSDIGIGQPVISPDGRFLIYTELSSMNKEGEEDPIEFSNIWRQDLRSPNRARVTFGRYQDKDPAFDSSGKYIYFSSDRNSERNRFGLWRVGVEGAGGITKISYGQSLDYWPSAGTGLVTFTSRPPYSEYPQIWSIQTNGNLLTQLREGDKPNLSPDGQYILFIRQDERTEKEQIWRMASDGGNETLLSGNSEVSDTDPRISPDGRFIVFSSDEGRDSEGRSNWDIWVMNSDGSGRTQLTTNGSLDDLPAWGASGQYIFFRSNRGFEKNIWRLEWEMPVEEQYSVAELEPQEIVTD